MTEQADTNSILSILSKGFPEYKIIDVVVKPQKNCKKYLIALWFLRGKYKYFKSTFDIEANNLSFFEGKICCYGSSTFILSVDIYNRRFASIMCEEI